MRQKIVAIVFCLLLLPALAAAEGKPAILANVTPESGTVGDPLTYTATITWPENLQVIPPEPEGSMGECAVLDRSASDLQTKDGIRSLILTLKLACYKAGEQTLPGLLVRFMDEGETGEKREETGPEVKVNILRTLPEDAKDIRPIKGQAEVPSDLTKPLLAASAALLIALALYWLLRRLRRKRKKQAAERIVPPEPYAYALSRFADWDAQGMLSRNEIAEFYFELTDILREYLEGRYGVQALEMTTTEISRALRDVPIDGFLKTDLKGILDRADLVKFARIAPESDRCRADLDQGKSFVEKTRPALPEQTEAKNGEAVS